jgi:hypothetical protein
MSRIVIVWVLLFSALGMAQEPVETSEESTPGPIQNNEEMRSIGGQTFVDDVFQNTRNLWGFSLSAYQSYTTDISDGSRQNQGSGIIAIIPRSFLNLGGQRSQFHADIGAGYRQYNRSNSLNSWDYYGDAQYTYRFSNRATLQFSDQFTSSFNDSWSFVSLYSPIENNSNFSSEAIFNRQRVTRNALIAELSTRISRKASVGVFGNYRLFRYPQNNLRNADTFEIGGNLDYRLTSWLNLTSRYSIYLNNVDEQLEDSRIHRIEAGGLDFHLSRSWRLWMNGGIEILNNIYDNRIGESANAGIEYTTLRSTISLTYQHGFTSGIGISRMLRSDTFSAEIGLRTTNWMSVNIQSYYERNKELALAGHFETLSWGGGLQFAVRRNLIISGNGYYQRQKTRDFSVQGLELNRLTSSVGLQYIWPSISRTGT